ncbi:TPA: hypothetical protein DCQ44_01250 [Candidatus Taylorbacteria bacterium]|nr:hypothetical protein [Candidatus Taylorbacteria bacterium]
MKLSTATKVLAVVLGSAIAVAFVLSATVVTKADAAGYIFTRNLTVGSVGADVMELQKVLNSNPATVVSASGVGSVGMESSYFGSLTKAALAKWQAANNIAPAIGYFGPLTRAAVNAAAPVITNLPAGCTTPSGYSTTTGVPCNTAANFPAGCTSAAGYSSTTGVKCDSSNSNGSVAGNGTDGTLTATQSSYVSSGITVKKGETKDVVAETLKASIGPVTVTRAGVHFNQRPWLLFSQVTLHDSTGKVIATKTLSSAADATEITVGSDYLVTFGNVNYTVTPGINPDLTVGVTVLPATDKIPTAGLPVLAGFDTLRTINGIGWTDTISAATIGSGIGGSSFTLTSVGSVADIYTRVSPNSALAHQVAVSLTQQTTDVPLGTFSLKSANNSSQLNTLTVTLASTTLSSGPSAAFSNVRLFDASGVSHGGTLTNDGTVVFSNLTIPLSQDAWQDFTVKTDVTASTTGTGITVALNGATGIVVTDANYGTATYESGTATSNAIGLTVNAVTISGASMTLGQSIGGQTPTGYAVNGTVTLTNNSNNDLYVSATTTTFLTQTVTVNGVASTTVNTNLGTLVSSASPATYAGDVAGVGYDIPAGLQRTFNFVGAVRGTSGQAVVLKVTTVNYGTTVTSNTGSTNTAGLDSMIVTGQF